MASYSDILSVNPAKNTLASINNIELLRRPTRIRENAMTPGLQQASPVATALFGTGKFAVRADMVLLLVRLMLGIAVCFISLPMLGTNPVLTGICIAVSCTVTAGLLTRPACIAVTGIFIFLAKTESILPLEAASVTLIAMIPFVCGAGRLSFDSMIYSLCRQRAARHRVKLLGSYKAFTSI